MNTSRELDRPKTLVVPLLPLTTGVVLPGMVVTIALETDEAREAGAAADGADSAIFVVPKIDGRYARIGTLARVEDAVRLPTRIEVRVIRGLQRAMLGTTVAEVGDAVWVQIEPIEDSAPASERVRELARVYRATVENIVEARGVPEVAQMLRGITDPGALVDTAGYSPDLSFEQKVEILQTLDVERRLELAIAWANRTLADLELKEKIGREGAEQQKPARPRPRKGPGEDEVRAGDRAELGPPHAPVGEPSPGQRGGGGLGARVRGEEGGPPKRGGRREGGGEARAPADE